MSWVRGKSLNGQLPALVVNREVSAIRFSEIVSIANRAAVCRHSPHEMRSVSLELRMGESQKRALYVNLFPSHRAAVHNRRQGRSYFPEAGLGTVARLFPDLRHGIRASHTGSDRRKWPLRRVLSLKAKVIVNRAGHRGRIRQPACGL